MSVGSSLLRGERHCKIVPSPGQQHDAKGYVLDAEENEIACATLFSWREANVLPVVVLLNISKRQGAQRPFQDEVNKKYVK